MSATGKLKVETYLSTVRFKLNFACVWFGIFDRTGRSCAIDLELSFDDF